MRRIPNNGQPFRQSIDDFFRQVPNHVTEDTLQTSGCTPANVAVGLASRDRDVREKVADDFRAFEALSSEAITKGQVEGAIASRQPPHILAHFLVVGLNGIQVKPARCLASGWDWSDATNDDHAASDDPCRTDLTDLSGREPP